MGAPAVAMAIDLYAQAVAGPARSRQIIVGANIPLHTLKQSNNPPSLNTRGLLKPLRLAVRETLDYIGDKRAGVNLDVDCQIPVGAGLGSSASTTVAIIMAVARARQSTISKQEILKIGFGPERFLHGNPSGVDHATSIYGGIIRFTKPNRISRLRLKQPPRILVCDSGIHHSTKKLVGAVVKKSRTKTRAFEAHVEEAREISDGVIKALRNRDTEELGGLMNLNHELLAKIGVSHPKLDKLVKTARANGALGAKLTGAGGGGCIIALSESRKEEVSIARALRREGGIPLRVSMDPEGARARAMSEPNREDQKAQFG